MYGILTGNTNVEMASAQRQLDATPRPKGSGDNYTAQWARDDYNEPKWLLVSREKALPPLGRPNDQLSSFRCSYLGAGHGESLYQGVTCNGAISGARRTALSDEGDSQAIRGLDRLVLSPRLVNKYCQSVLVRRPGCVFLFFFLFVD